MADTLDALLSSMLGGGLNSGAEAADIGTFQKQIAGNDIFSQLVEPVSASKFDTTTWTPNQTLGTSIGKAFLGSILGEVGKQRQANQIAKVAGILPALYEDPSSVAIPEGVDPGAFSSLRANVIARSSKSKSDQLGKLFNDVMATRLAGEAEKLKTMGKIAGENEAYGTGQNPNDPRLGLADTLRKEIIGNKEIIDFKDVRNKIGVLQKAMLDNRSVSDLDFIYGVAKVLDPGSVVRESDSGMVIDSASIPAATLGYLNKYVNAGTGLDSKQRVALFDLAKRHLDTRKERVSSIIDDYSELAGRRGLNPTDILGSFTKDTLSPKLQINQNQYNELRQRGYSKEQIGAILGG